MPGPGSFLIVEAEFLIALDIQRVLEGVNASHCILATSTAEARMLVGDTRDLTLAVLDFRSSDADRLAFARDLTMAGVPLVLLVSELGLRNGFGDLPGAPVVIKPFLEEELASAAKRALAG